MDVFNLVRFILFFVQILVNNNNNNNYYYYNDDNNCLFTAVLRKVVGKSERDNRERYCGWFCLPCSPKKIERMAREATGICSRVLVESNKSRFDSYSR